MKHYKNVVETVKNRKLVGLQCDFCHRIEKNPRTEVEWLLNEATSVDIYVSMTSFDQDGPEPIRLDCCPECFRNKIMSLTKKRFNA